MAYLEQRYANEPYRLVLSLLAADLEAASEDDMTARLLEDTPHRARVTTDELRLVLDLVADAVPAALTDDGLRRVRRQLEIFGLQAARLDLREDSGRLAATVGRMLAALGSITDFEQGDDAQRTAFLLRLLKDDPPAAATLTAAAGAHEASDETWRLFRLLARAGACMAKNRSAPSSSRWPMAPPTFSPSSCWRAGRGAHPGSPSPRSSRRWTTSTAPRE